MFDPTRESIILSDVHLGKTYHYRKNGIPLSKELARANIDRIHRIISKHKAKELLILGDLFHSIVNSEWDDFKALRFHFSKTQFILVQGNHDIFPKEEYLKANILVCDEMERDGILFSHEAIQNRSFNVFGHIHPAIRLRGKGRQSLRLPCFFQDENLMILPAFGAGTGMHCLKPSAKAQVFGIAEHLIFKANREGQGILE